MRLIGKCPLDEQDLIIVEIFSGTGCSGAARLVKVEHFAQASGHESADLFLGVPFNIASYALLLMMVAQVSGLKPGEFIHSFGDAHIYRNHLDQVQTQLSRSIRPRPTMVLNPARTDIFSFTYDDFTLSNYDPHPAISAPIAI